MVPAHSIWLLTVLSLLCVEAHLREDGYVLEEAVEDKDKIMFDQTVSLACGRCSRFAYILKTEMKENPAHYSAEQRDKITSKIQSIERKCKDLYSVVLRWTNEVLFSSSYKGVSKMCIKNGRKYW